MVGDGYYGRLVRVVALLPHPTAPKDVAAAWDSLLQGNYGTQYPSTGVGRTET